ncbi:MAG: GNAT family N-acetyltransferase [Gammaproteobacteria bacterium]|nr:GNAT family N-acetyltransferase [Gammaproteobacteria bacterium]MBU0787183.1 GNAT family N-acetyltransferase [Gammaproteobacteria bacterium]MBU0814190.1 GNAT family N-acetyltransferase [Gammaproteobacteria bacterium]MBU1786290.1 GNAT family N-acetyltransferase [Gammaproteobacteria bacterium]
MPSPVSLRICRADYHDPVHAAALVALLDAYAQDPMGGGHALSDFARTNLVAELAARPQAFSVLAFSGVELTEPVGLVNCIEGFSTFACRPLVNVHDVAVLPQYRGQRVGERMLQEVEHLARARGACKLTLEVLQGNASAIRLYERSGFAGYQLDPAMGSALFLQKWLDQAPDQNAGART